MVKIYIKSTEHYKAIEKNEKCTHPGTERSSRHIKHKEQI